MKIPLGNSLLTISIMKCSDGSCCVLQRSLAPSPFLIEKSSVPILMSFKDQGECISSIRPGELPNWSYSSSPLNSKHISHPGIEDSIPGVRASEMDVEGARVPRGRVSPHTGALLPPPHLASCLCLQLLCPYLAQNRHLLNVS